MDLFYKSWEMAVFHFKKSCPILGTIAYIIVSILFIQYFIKKSSRSFKKILALLYEIKEFLIFQIKISFPKCVKGYAKRLIIPRSVSSRSCDFKNSFYKFHTQSEREYQEITRTH